MALELLSHAEGAEGAEQLLARADRTMYHAKNSGKNRGKNRHSIAP